MADNRTAVEKRKEEAELHDSQPRNIRKKIMQAYDHRDISIADWTKAAGGNYDEVISVIVGPGDEAKTYLVHAKVLARSSHFFKAYKEKTIEMPDDDPTIVNLYIECCYRKHVLVSNPRSGLDSSLSAELACHLWVLTDKLQDAPMKRLVMAYIFGKRFLLDWLTPAAVDAAFLGPDDSKLVEFLLDAAVFFPNSVFVKNHLEDLPVEYHTKLAAKFLVQARNEQPSASHLHLLNHFTNKQGEPDMYYDDILSQPPDDNSGSLPNAGGDNASVRANRVLTRSQRRI